MATVSDIVTAALRKIGVASQGDAIEAMDLQDAIEALNRMLFAWKLSGVDTTPTALAATDDFPLSPEYEEGTIYVLASRLSTDYEVPQAFDADDYFRKIQAAYMLIDDVPMPKAMLNLSATRRATYR